MTTPNNPSVEHEHKDKWIVQRIEEHGSLTRTIELPEDEAASLYANWCSRIRNFNDQSISLIRVSRSETVVSLHTNTEFNSLR